MTSASPLDASQRRAVPPRDAVTNSAPSRLNAAWTTRSPSSTASSCTDTVPSFWLPDTTSPPNKTHGEQPEQRFRRDTERSRCHFDHNHGSERLPGERTARSIGSPITLRGGAPAVDVDRACVLGRKHWPATEQTHGRPATARASGANQGRLANRTKKAAVQTAFGPAGDTNELSFSFRKKATSWHAVRVRGRTVSA